MLKMSRSLIDIAAELGNLDIIKYIIDNKYSTPSIKTLTTAAKYGHIPIVKYLVDIHIDIHSNNSVVLRQAVKGNYIDVVQYLISI